MREYRILLDFSISFDTLESNGEPVGKGKVDSFVEIESVVEARVVRAREGDDEFVWSLVDSVDVTTILLEVTGTHEGDELEEEIGLLIEEFGCSSLHRSFELFIVFSRDSIPSLRISEMMIVDAIRKRECVRGAWKSQTRDEQGPTSRCNDLPCAMRKLKRPFRRRSKESSFPRCQT